MLYFHPPTFFSTSPQQSKLFLGRFCNCLFQLLNPPQPHPPVVCSNRNSKVILAVLLTTTGVPYIWLLNLKHLTCHYQSSSYFKFSQQSFVLSFKQTTESFCCRSANLIVEIVKRNIFYTRVNHKLFQRLTVEGSTLQKLCVNSAKNVTLNYKRTVNT